MQKLSFRILFVCFSLIGFFGFSGCSQSSKNMQTEMKQHTSTHVKIMKSENEWKEQLTEMQFYVAREKGTERAFTGEFWDSKKTGVYTCVCCDLPLFESDTKFKSGTGWPSFFASIDKNNVGENRDSSHGMVRTEVVCSRCDAHLGHLFMDGPQPTGMRYCINSASLKLEEATK